MKSITRMLLAAVMACSASIAPFTAAQAATFSLTLNSNLALDMSGNADVALLGDPGNVLFPDVGGGLAADGGPASVDGWGFLNVDAALTTSGAGVSSVSTNIFIDNSTGVQDVTVTTDISVFFDLVLTDVDGRLGRNFADGLGVLTGEAADATGNTVTFSPAQSLDVSLSQSFQVACPVTGCGDPTLVEIIELGSSTIANQIQIDLLDGNGVALDLNGNGANDFLKFSASNFLVGDADLNDVVIGDIVIPDENLAEVLDALLAFALGGDGAASIETPIGITSGSLDFEGKTGDALVDPPWTIALAGSIVEPLAAVPAPGTALLLGAGLAFLTRRARSRR